MKKLTILIPLGLGLLLAILSLIVLPNHALASNPIYSDPAPTLLTSTDAGTVIVQYFPGDIDVQPISFTAPISGLAALELTGIDVVIKDFGWGIGICSIGGIGCPQEDCFCDPSYFWNYGFWDGNDWQSYAVGAADSSVEDGGIEGWRWGEWDADPIPPPEIAHALDWLHDQQYPDGGYGNHSSSAETIISIGAANLKGAEWRHEIEESSLLSYWLVNGSDYSRKGASESGKLAVGLQAADMCHPYAFKDPMQYYNTMSGQFDPESGFHAWAMLGAAAMNSSIPENATIYLEHMVQDDGGWEWNTGFGSDTNSTSIAIQALIAAGVSTDSITVTNGMSFIKNSQNADGGFYYSSKYGTDSDTNSSAYAVQAIIAAGEDPTTDRWIVGETNPIEFLLSMQLANGSFEWRSGFGPNILATQQVIPALLRKPFPIRTRELNVCPTKFLPIIYQHSP